MKILRLIALAAVLNVTTAFAADVPASESSIRELLRVTNARSLIDEMWGQIDGMMKTALDQSLAGQSLTPAQREGLDRLSARVQAVLREELDWAKLEPMYIGIYRESFTQEEVDGLIAFYNTPAGRALIKKMPLVMQKAMGAMQERMGPMLQKIQSIQNDFMAELQAAEKP